MANTGKDRLSGNAKPNRRTETATFVDLHGFPLFRRGEFLRRVVWNLTRRRGGEYRVEGEGQRTMPSAWPRRYKFSAASPEGDRRA